MPSAHHDSSATVQCVNTASIVKKMKALKKIKRKMGLGSRVNGLPPSHPATPIFFHNIHGENVRISRDAKVARRTQSFCKGIVFSNRPVQTNERVYVRMLEIANNWSGILRFGYTSVNPGSQFLSLPKYVCPDLTSRDGYWAKALSERHGTEGKIVHFYVNNHGCVIYGIDNEDIGVFMEGIDVKSPLWVVMDVYGNSTALEFVDYHSVIGEVLNSNRATSSRRVQNTNGVLSNRSNPPQPPAPYPSVTVADEIVNIPGIGDLSISDPAVLRSIQRQPTTLTHPLNFHKNVLFAPLAFHTIKGANTSFADNTKTVASRTANEYCKGYVFTEKPLAVNEKIVIQVLKTERHYVGALGFGITSASPNNLCQADLPEDCDDLLDRSEYWVVCKDVAAVPNVGDELAFTYYSNGQITLAKNNAPPQVIMHVDTSLQLYAFFDIFGDTASIRILGSIKVPLAPRSVDQQNRDQLHRRIAGGLEVGSGSIRVADKNIMNSSSPQRTEPSTGNDIIDLIAQAIEQRRVENNNTPAQEYHIEATLRPNVSSSSSSSSSISLEQRTTSRPQASVMSARFRPPSTTNSLSARHLYNQHQQQQLVLESAASASTNRPSSSTNYQSAGVVSQTPPVPPFPSASSTISTSNDHNSTLSGECSECSVCYERGVDSVLYSCGHMCMCYQCALQQWRGRGGGHCPICRAVIKDVIRTYRA